MAKLLPKQVTLYALPFQGPTMHGKGEVGLPALHSSGQGTAALVDWFLRNDRKRFFAFEAMVKNSVPGVEEVHIATPSADSRQLELEIEGGFRISANQASAGTRLMLFFIALAWHPEPPELVMIEEPENGIHPRRLAEVMGLIREQIGFDGLIMTDDISMKALKGDLGDLSRRAIAAGCDVILHCNGTLPERMAVAEAAGEMTDTAQARAEAAIAARQAPDELDIPAAEADLSRLMRGMVYG